VNKLACLVRAHRRAESLRVVLQELEAYKTFDSLEVHVEVLADRPTAEVKRTISDAGLEYTSLPFPILGPSGERFLDAQNFHLETLEFRYSPDWVYVVDDDSALDFYGAARLPDQLARSDVDAFYIPSMYIEDKPFLYNAARKHNSIWLYRHAPGARFSGKRMLSMPDDPHDAAVMSGRTAQYPGTILEVGGYSAADREATAKAYREAGKDDAFTRALLEGRDLREVPLTLHSPFTPWLSNRRS
jgi:hypothetical protein